MKRQRITSERCCCINLKEYSLGNVEERKNTIT